MSKFSKCHKAKIYWMKHHEREHPYPEEGDLYVMVPHCSKCHKPTKVEEKEVERMEE